MMKFPLTLYILLTDIVVFTLYVVFVLVKFGIPVNLSVTYYYLERKTKCTGWLFALLMLFICCTTIPLMAVATIRSSSPDLCLLIPAVAFVCLLSVAASARYKKKKRLIYFHYTCAIIAAVCVVAWINVVAYRIFYVGLTVLIAFVYAGLRTKTMKKCSLFWLESAAFYSVFATLLVIDCFFEYL